MKKKNLDKLNLTHELAQSLTYNSKKVFENLPRASLIEVKDLSDDERKSIAKLIAEVMYFKFMNLEVMQEYKIFVQELISDAKKASRNRLIVRPPDNVTLSIPNQLRKTSLMLKPIIPAPEGEKTVNLKSTDIIIEDNEIITDSNRLKKIDDDLPLEMMKDTLNDDEIAKINQSDFFDDDFDE